MHFDFIHQFHDLGLNVSLKKCRGCLLTALMIEDRTKDLHEFIKVVPERNTHGLLMRGLESLPPFLPLWVCLPVSKVAFYIKGLLAMCQE